MRPTSPSLEPDRAASPADPAAGVSTSLAAKVAASPKFWDVVSTALAIAAVGSIVLGEDDVAPWVFYLLLGGSWVASLIGRTIDPDHGRDRRWGDGGWWGGDGDGG
jgi:hypothetical protein